MASTELTRVHLVDETERWFQRRGLPYTGTNDVSPLLLVNRVLPLLVLTLIAEVITMSLGGQYRGWTLLGVFLLTTTGMVLLGLLVSTRRPRRTWSLPRWATAVAASLFVAGPAFIVLGVEQESQVMFALLIINIGVLVGASLLEYYNVLPIVRHEFAEIRSGQRKFFPPMRQVLPVLLIALLFLFMTAEIWQVSHDMTAFAYAIIIVALIGFSAGFVVAQLQDRLDRVAHFDSWDEVDEVARATTAPFLPLPDDRSDAPDLEADEVGKHEVSLFVFIVLTVQLVVVATVVAAALAVFGALVVRKETILQWTELESADWDPIVAVVLFSNEYALTKETVLMSGLLGVVAAMQFAISIMTDSDFSAEHVNGIRADARELLAVRARYGRYLADDARAE